MSEVYSTGQGELYIKANATDLPGIANKLKQTLNVRSGVATSAVMSALRGMQYKVMETHNAIADGYMHVKFHGETNGNFTFTQVS